MSVTAFSQYKVYEYVNSGTPALATYTGMTFTQDGTNFLDALNTSSPSVVSMPANYIATCDSNYRYNVSQMTAYSNIGANFPSNGSYEFENQTTKFVLKIKDLRGNIAYSKDLEIDMNTTYFGFFMNSNGIGGVIIYRINDANCDVVIKGNSTFDNMYKTVYTIDGRDPLPDLEGGGAGSGYIGNSLLSNKKMVGYNVPTSSAESTKTESVNDVSASAVSGKPKSGNGFAKIKFLREVTDYIIYDNSVSPIRIDERIDNNDKWYRSHTSLIGIQSDYIGENAFLNQNVFMSSTNTFSKGAYKYLYITGENLSGSGQYHYASVSTTPNRIERWQDCYNDYETVFSYRSEYPNNVVRTIRKQIDNLEFSDFHITIFGSDSQFRVYKMWLSAHEIN